MTTIIKGAKLQRMSSRVIEEKYVEARAAAVAGSRGSENPAKPNILCITGDDMWAGELPTYELDPGNNEPELPVLSNRLTPLSVLFDWCHSKPLCSPSRAAFNTGIYGFHAGNGVGDLAEFGNQPLPVDAVTIAHVLQTVGYRCAAIGKWHLSSEQNGLERHPIIAGYDFWQGSIRNLLRPRDDYYGWDRTTASRTPDGIAYTTDRIDRYCTTQTVDDALRWIDAQGGDPWFMNLNFNTPHAPLQVPPAGTFDNGAYPILGADRYNGTQIQRFKAMIQNMDFEIGRLLDGIPQRILANTHVVFVGDNGSDNVQDPWPNGHTKRTCYQPGIRVPCLWSGPNIDAPGRKYSEWFQLEDFFPTFATLAGVDLSSAFPTLTIDGVDHTTALTDRTTGELRDTGYAEAFAPNGAHTGATKGGIRAIMQVHDYDEMVDPGPPPAYVTRTGGRFKLMRFVAGTTFPEATDQFYNMTLDPVELTNLIPGGSSASLPPSDLAAYNAMVSAFTTLVNS